MVTTNIVRKVDRVGRVSLPLSLRERLGFAKQDPLEMHAEENRIIVRSGSHEEKSSSVDVEDHSICRSAVKRSR